MTRAYPIIFSDPMVQAIREGRKTMTRRLAWREFTKNTLKSRAAMRATTYRDGTWWEPSPWQARRPGDWLYVREAWAQDRDGAPLWRADRWGRETFTGEPVPKWRPSIHHPRRFSRFALRVTSVRIEPLQAISQQDAIAEGVERASDAFMGAGFLDYLSAPLSDGTPSLVYRDPRRSFESLWRRLHGADAWDRNPEVVVLGFRVHPGNVDTIIAQEAA